MVNLFGVCYLNKCQKYFTETNTYVIVKMLFFVTISLHWDNILYDYFKSIDVLLYTLKSMTSFMPSDGATSASICLI